MTRRRFTLTASLVASLLGGCETPMHSPESSPLTPSVAEPGSVREFEARQRRRAQALDREGRLADAVDAWSALALLKPAQYGGELADAKRRADAAAQEHLARAKRESARGNTAGAEQLYLAALSARPDLPEAAEALRSIERSRNRREFLGKPGRVLQTRADTPAKAPASSGADGSGLLELEQVSTLAAQGELGEAIETLERRLKKSPRDEATRKLLADLYFKQARKLYPGNAAQARASVERCLKLEPRHLEAQALLNLLDGKGTK